MGRVISLRELDRTDLPLAGHEWTADDEFQHGDLFDKLSLALRTDPDDAASYAALSHQAREQLRQAAMKVQHMRQRQRAKLPEQLSEQPVWDMLLHLLVRGIDDGAPSAKSACQASGCSASIALRWLSEMAREGLIMSDTANDPSCLAGLKLSHTGLQWMATILLGDSFAEGIFAK